MRMMRTRAPRGDARRRRDRRSLAFDRSTDRERRRRRSPPSVARRSTFWARSRARRARTPIGARDAKAERARSVSGRDEIRLARLATRGPAPERRAFVSLHRRRRLGRRSRGVSRVSVPSDRIGIESNETKIVMSRPSRVSRDACRARVVDFIARVEARTSSRWPDDAATTTREVERVVPRWAVCPGFRARARRRPPVAAAPGIERGDAPVRSFASASDRARWETFGTSNMEARARRAVDAHRAASEDVARATVDASTSTTGEDGETTGVNRRDALMRSRVARGKDRLRRPCASSCWRPSSCSPAANPWKKRL